MAQIIWFNLFLLVVGYCRALPNELSNNAAPRNFKKETGYGRPVLAMANSPRCTFSGKPIEDGKSVSSPEPCLNCTCSKGILLCYLHTCNSVVPVQGCQVIKQPGTCCPQLECSGAQYNDFRTERTSEASHKYRLRQDDANFFGLLGVDPRTDRSAITTPTTRKPFPQNWNQKGNGLNFSFLKGLPSQRKSDDLQTHYEQEEDYAEDELSPDRNNSAGYCISRGYKYAEGMAMLSSTKCEYCYCIGGQKMCVRPKCHLNIDGCLPRYQSGYTCCPSHYNCEIAAGASSMGNADENYQIGSGNETQLPNRVTSCNVEGYDFDVGVAVPSSGHCQTCYCTTVGVVCRRLECSPTVPGCTPVIPEGHCCPTQYKCDQKVFNSTHVPVSHSTDNYDVTVISPSVSDYGTSSQASRTENPGISTDNNEEIYTTDTEEPETSTGANSEKQKITVELSEESDLESISVIPEENIAVLVLTTENEDSENRSEDSTTYDITNETSTRDEENSILTDTPTPSAKRKFKPTKTNTYSKNRNSTWLSTVDSITKPITVTTHNQDTTRESSSDNDKETYAYDYVELYDDVSPNTLETFDPFSDYSIQPHDETIFTEEERERTTSNIRNNIKEKRPQTNTFSYQPNTSTGVTSIIHAKYPIYRTTNTETDGDRSTYSTPSRGNNNENISDSPTRYTIYNSERTSRPETTAQYLTTRHNSPQMHKQRRPGIITKYQTTLLRTQNTKPTHLITSSEITSEDVRTAQTVPFDPTADGNTYTPYTEKTNIQTYTPYIRPYNSNKKKISNRRRIPENSPQTTAPRKSTQTVPQDIAEFLWSITQSHNTPTTSTEIQDGTTGSGTGVQGYFSETLPPIALAAPKLILEEPTSEITHGTAQTESTNMATNPASPSFNFQAPEIIFSNHGPMTNRKQLPPLREPEAPLIINNHKKTSTRLRPPIRNRPPATQPSIENSYLEISNHRPTNSFRRPPSKFPPYPHFVSKDDGGYYRDPHVRDSHPKLHRFDTDDRPEWSEDYEEYYYDTDNDRSITTSTKIFNNIQENQSTIPAADTTATDSDSKIPLANKNDLTTDQITSTDSESAVDESTAQTTHKEDSTEFPPESTVQGTKLEKNGSLDDIDGRSSENKDEVEEETVRVKISTTPFPKSTYYLPTLTTTTTTSVIYDTTKSFSGYVRNKHKGTSTHILNNEGKFFRAEDNNKSWETVSSDPRLIVHGKKPTDTFMIFSDFPDKPPEPSTELPTPPPKVEEDSKEITDVCFVEGRYYISGETIIKTNPCEMCRCFYGHPLCQVQQCPPPPEESCVLDYLPGYCCPRVTCGIEMDPDQPPGIISVSAPEPTSQEIRPKLVETDNQWKPLPHGPIVRTTESIFKMEVYENKPKENTNFEDVEIPESQTEKITVFTNNQKVSPVDSRFEISNYLKESHQLTTTPSTTTTLPMTSPPVFATTLTETSTPPTYTANVYTTEEPSTTEPSSTIDSSITDDIVTVPADITTTLRPPEPVFEPESSDKGYQNKSQIHDNSSGVRKILDNVITLPSSKVSLSQPDGSNIDTVIPVIVTLPTTVVSDDEFGKESVTLGSADLVRVSTELGVNLKVSGCNVYGKYYKINDKVTALSKPCSDCICTADGIACNATC